MTMYQGHEVMLHQLPRASQVRRGFISTAFDSASQQVPEVLRRWTSLWDAEADNFISPEEHAELVGHLPIPYDSRMTRRQLSARVIDYQREAHMSQYKSRWFAELVGALPVWFWDPVNVATLPIGGPALGMARQAATVGKMLRHVGRAGVQIAAVSAPLEMAVQAKALGEFRADYLGMTVAAPFPFLAGMGLAGRGLKAFRGKLPVDVDVPMSSLPKVDADAITSIQLRAERPYSGPIKNLVDEYKANDHRVMENIRRVDPGPEVVPTARLNAAFEGYPGGAKKWLVDFNRGDEGARGFARQLGVDLDSDVIQNFLRELRDTSRRSGTPPETHAYQREALERIRRGTLTEEDTPSLQDVGILTREGDLTPEFKTITDAWQKPMADWSPEERALVQAFNEGGAAGVYETLIRRASTEIDTASPVDLPQLQARINDLVERGPKQIDATAIDEKQLMAVLDAARLESTPTTPQYAPGGAAVGRTVVEFADIEAAARKAGVDIDEVNANARTLDDLLRKC